MTIDTSIFKDYDIRGIYPDQINGEVAIKIGYGLVRTFHPKSVCICRDMRLSGEEIRDGLTSVFVSQGIDVFDAGLTGTEMQYFIAGTKPYDIVLMISASHNPPEYNGIKVALRGPVAVTSESGLFEIRDQIQKEPLPDVRKPGKVRKLDIMDAWKSKILSLIDVTTLGNLKVVADAGNGMAGVLIQKVFAGLPVKIIPIYFDPDGHFPHHIPNPLIEKNNQDLIQNVLNQHADVGLTFDGDADRMFLVDDTGRTVSGTITTALLSAYILRSHPGETILYNAICGRIVPQIIKKYGGRAMRVRVGHSYIKTYMRETHAIFAGEHSGHYYHRSFFSAESGVLTALMVLSMLSREKRKLSALVDELAVYPSSGEINFVVHDMNKILDAIRYGFTDAQSKDEVDGISVWYKEYWFNVRASKTEPLLRLNVEADTKEILGSITKELIQKIESLGGKKK